MTETQMSASHAGVAPDVGVVIVAAGAGTRTGSSELKQFRWVGGKPMLLHSVQMFQSRPDVALVVTVLPRDYAADPPPWLFQCDLDRLLVSAGGRHRSDSVRHGLEDLPMDIKIAVIHDAARPLVTEAAIDAVITEARKGNAVTTAIPEVDTLKRVDDTGHITATVPRDGIWRAQTPQAFPFEMIMQAHRDAVSQQIDATDDAALCERLDIPVKVVPGSERAMKITTEADFARAEVLTLWPG